jgi:hypothetical protein
MAIVKKGLLGSGLVYILLAAACLAWWMSLTDSKKRFYKHLGKQLPAMPLRYFA